VARERRRWQHALVAYLNGRLTLLVTLVAVAALVTLVGLTSSACSDPQPLDRAKAGGMIEATRAFQAPLDEGLRKLDPRFAAAPSMKRELLDVEALTVKPDGPFGWAGKTATVSFVWRFSRGPLAGVPHRTLAKIHGDARGWKVYEDQLARNLRQAIASVE